MDVLATENYQAAVLYIAMLKPGFSYPPRILIVSYN